MYKMKINNKQKAKAVLVTSLLTKFVFQFFFVQILLEVNSL